MIKKHSLIFLLFLVHPLFAQDNHSSPMEIKIGLTHAPPIIILEENSPPDGMLVDFLKAVAERENWNITWVQGAWSDVMLKAKNSEIDIMTYIVNTPERAQFFNFSSEIFVTGWGQVYSYENNMINNILDLYDKKIAVMRGDIHAKRFSNLCQEYAVNCLLTYTDDYDGAFKLLEDNAVYGVVAGSTVGVSYEQKSNVIRTPIMFNPSNALFASPKKNSTRTLAIIDEYLIQWRSMDDSPYKKIQKKWMDTLEKTDIPQWVNYLVIGTIALLLISIFITLLLRNQIKKHVRQHINQTTQLKQIINLVPHMIYVVNAQGNLVLVNEYAAKHFGVAASSNLTKKQLLALPQCTNLFDGDNELIENRKALIKKELVTRNDANSEVIFNIFKVPFDTNNKRPSVLTVGVDITEQLLYQKQTTSLLEQSQKLNAQQKKLNTELVISNQKARQATASKSIFLANMSHEIRTPINGIIGLLGLVLKTELTKKQQNYLNKANYSSQILMSLINDILDFSKIEAGKLDIENVTFSLNSVFTNLLANISNLAQDKNLNIHFYADPSLPYQLVGDPLRINQVLLNICSNAIKFSRNGCITINITHQKNQGDQRMTLCTEVIDTGIGMTDEQLLKIFTPFTQADGSTNRKYGGTGLGLSIVKQLVDLMDGKLSASSKLHKGSTFTVELPLSYVNSTHTILASPNIDRGKLYYFKKAPTGLVTDDYFEHLGLNYYHFPITQLSKIVEQITDEDTVIIDIANQQAHRENWTLIKTLSENGINTGFITDTQPINLPLQLHDEWSHECLTHPFSHQQFLNFIHGSYKLQPKSKDRVSFQEGEKQGQYQGHILLVEDNKINQLVTGEMLEALGISYDIAENGKQAVTKIINSLHYDMVLMDIQMPLMDGYEATLTLRESGFTDLIICGLSANAMKQDYAKAREVGMNDYLTKPIKQFSFEKVLSKYLATKEGP